MNKGIQNEHEFVQLFNGRYLYELKEKEVIFLRELFGEIIDENEEIICWKNKMVQKADIFIKYKNYVKSISIKCGHNNSIHQEQVQEFKKYLSDIGIPYKISDKYFSYHYGYLLDENGKRDFSKLLSSDEYKKLYQNDIDIFNKYINKTKIIVSMVDRFIVRGRNSNFDIDALICGTVDDYEWIMKYDIYDLVLSNKYLELTSPHVACMTLGPKGRNLNCNPQNMAKRYIVCARWNNLKKDIINFKNNNY